MAIVTMKYGDYTFSPIPLLSYSSTKVRDDNDKTLYNKVTLSFSGHILNVGGNFGSLDEAHWSPLESGLSLDRQELIIFHESGMFVSGIFPTVESFQVEESVWVDHLKYSFSLSYQDTSNTDLGASGLIENQSDQWQWQEQDTDQASVSHTVSAKGINTASSTSSSNALEHAKSYVDSKLGTSNIPSTFPSWVLSSYVTKNYLRRLYSESVDQQNSTYSVTENFIFASGSSNYIRRETYQYTKGADSIISVVVNGDVQGGGDTALDRTKNALSGYIADLGNVYLAASGVYVQFGGIKTLNSTPSQRSLTKNPNAGKINYSFTFSDKVDGNPAGVVDSNYSIDDARPQHVYVSVPIPGKMDGPVWQDINTITDGVYTISGDVIGETIVDAISYAQELINTYGGQSKGTERRISSQTMKKNLVNNSVSFSVSWTYRGDEATGTLS